MNTHHPTICLLLLCSLILWAGPARANVFEKTDPQTEVELGRMVAHYIESVVPLSPDAALQCRVERVGQAVVAQLDKPVYPYQFKVLSLPDYNAFSVPGGFIYVYEGLLANTPTDDELAFIIAHEVTHADHRHWARQTEKMKRVDLISVALIALLGQRVSQAADIVSLANAIVYFRYSRDMEREADSNGLLLAWKAGYGPEGALAAMHLMERLEAHADMEPRFLREHPAAEERRRELEKACEELETHPRTPGPAAFPPDPPEARLTGKLPAGKVFTVNPWFPLAPGNRWSYRVTTDGADTEYTLRILGQATTGAVYNARLESGAGVAIASQFVTTASEVYQRGVMPDTDAPWVLAALTDALPDGAAPADESLTLRCGTFRALHVRYTHEGRTVDAWYAKGIGLLKRVCQETGVTETLTAFDVSHQ